MAQGRVSANPAMAAAIVALLCLIAGAKYATAKTFTVGNEGGWTFNIADWPNGKSFKAGDVLVFKYNPAVHDVAIVNEAGYSGCSASPGDKVFNSGSDSITLPKGKSYFLCTRPAHCDLGQKIAIDAA